MRKHEQLFAARLRPQELGVTIADLPTLRSKKAAAWIGPANTTKFAVGDDVHFHPIAGGLMAAASESYVVKARMPERRAVTTSSTRPSRTSASRVKASCAGRKLKSCCWISGRLDCWAGVLF